MPAIPSSDKGYEPFFAAYPGINRKDFRRYSCERGQGEFYWKHPSANVYNDAYVGADALIGPECIVDSKSEVGASCILYHGVEVKRSHVESHGHFANCVIHDSRIEFGVRVGLIETPSEESDRTQIRQSRIGPHGVIGSNVNLSICNLAYNVNVGSKVRLLNSTLQAGVHFNSTADYESVFVHAGVVVEDGDWWTSMGPVGSRGDYFTVVEDHKTKMLTFYVGCDDGGRSILGIAERVHKTHAVMDGSVKQIHVGEHFLEYMYPIYMIERMRIAHWRANGIKLKPQFVPADYGFKF